MKLFLWLWQLALAASLYAGQSVTLEWDASSDSGVTYRLLWGPRSGEYTQSADAGTALRWSLPVESDALVFFVVVALSSEGYASDPSNEVFVLVGPAPWLTLSVQMNYSDGRLYRTNQLGVFSAFAPRMFFRSVQSGEVLTIEKSESPEGEWSPLMLWSVEPVEFQTQLSLQ